MCDISWGLVNKLSPRVNETRVRSHSPEPAAWSCLGLCLCPFTHIRSITVKCSLDYTIKLLHPSKIEVLCACHWKTELHLALIMDCKLNAWFIWLSHAETRISITQKQIIIFFLSLNMQLICHTQVFLNILSGIRGVNIMVGIGGYILAGRGE